MHEVTCFHCGHIVHITPDAERCSVCGEDLKHLIPPGYASGYFYKRADQMSAGGDAAAALAEVERGLEYGSTPELRLLGAILAKRLNLFDRMRHHVAMIPVDDALRGEAEWLVRSHQEHQRGQREGQKSQRSAPVETVKASEEAFDLDELLGDEPPPPPAVQRSPRLAALPATAAGIAVVILIGWLYAERGDNGLTGLLQVLSNTPASIPATPGGEAEPARQELETAPAEDGQANEDPAPAPTATVPPNLVQSPTESPARAERDPSGAQESDIFDLKTYLSEAGYFELAELEISARIDGERLILQGFVPMALYRSQLVAIAKEIPGISEVTDVDLLLRTPPIYIVQEGDTLWSIVFNLYGDVERLNEFHRANSDVLPSADALTIGMVLKVPPN